ncbi:MAG TPA: YHS domain-containing (seleno)protein [Vicinamibacterales bacterium]|nr:YHS domain-containing (seleno)protein [Vicinamibacterales bacterium]
MFRCSFVDTTLKAVAVVLLAGSVATGVAALNAEGGQSVNRNKEGLAIDGYDPVAYFVDGAAVPGRTDLTVVVNGTTYRFSTAANRDRFQQDPSQFLPQYGGFCAYAVSRGYTANIDPQAWKVVDGKLYLNYSKRVQRTWQEDIPGNIRKADANWPGLRDKE